MDDSSDILGGQLRVARHDRYNLWSNLSSLEQLLMLAAVVVVVVSAQHLYPIYKQYQEKRHRKQMRRRHGIPDNDPRPFNVAYAAANKARLEREAGDKSRSRVGSAVPQPASSGQQRSDTTQGQAAIRQRHGLSDQRKKGVRSGDTISGGLQHGVAPQRRAAAVTDTAETPAIGHSEEPLQERQRPSSTTPSLYQPAFTRAAPLTRQESELLGPSMHGKQGLDRDVETGSEKENRTFRVEDGSFAEDGDRSSELHGDDMDVDAVPLPLRGQRGSKRMASLGDESFDAGRPRRDKRARRLARMEGEEVLDDTMEQDAESNPRGKKRDRGSSFDVEEFIADGEDEKARRHRRRRVTSHKKTTSETSRGRKRGRDPESIGSDEEYSDTSSKRTLRHKRGKKTSAQDSESADEWMISNDPLCRGRRIGEQWEVGGVCYKVGPNGQRLRKELIRQLRSRFPMPRDSEHPDRRANIDVFVEMWLTEEQFQEAKNKQELSWQHQQSPTRRSSPTETLPDVPDTPTKGKNLLWSSAAPSASRRGSLPPSSSTASLRVNPFQSSSSLRRLSTLTTPSTLEAPKLPYHARSYSKWEKQDLEAAAMAKLREKVKRETASSPDKPSAPVGPAAAPAANATSAARTASPTQTTSKAPTDSSAAPKASAPFSFGAPPAVPSVASATKATTSSLPTLNIPSTEPAKAAIQLPTAPAKAAAGEASKSGATPPPFFAQSDVPAAPPTASAVPALTSTAVPGAASLNIPNFFAKPVSPAPAAAAPSAPSNVFGAPLATHGAKVSSAQSQQPTFPFATPRAHAAASETKSDSKPATGPSLLSRLSGFAAPALGADSSSAAAPPPAAASSAAPAAPVFSFSKPAAASTTAVPAAAVSAATTSGAPTGAPKFSFGLTANAPISAMSAPATAGSSEPAKPTFSFSTPKPTATASEPPKFSFGAQPSSTTAGSATPSDNASDSPMLMTPPKDSTPQDATMTPKPTFSFGNNVFTTTPAGEPKIASTFGATTTPAGPPKFSFGATTTPAGEPPKTSTFANAAAASNGSRSTSVFGNPTTTPAGEPRTASMFGGNSTTNAGASSSTFGNPTMTPEGEPKATSVFSNPLTTPAGQPKTASIFTNTTTPAGEPPKPSFSFNAPPSSTTFNFGKPSGPESSSNTIQTGSGAAKTFTFGQPSTSTATATAPKTEGPTNPFTFGPSSSSMASVMTSAKPTEQSKPTFAFTAPTNGTSTFTFGAPATSMTTSTTTPAAGSAFGTAGFGTTATQSKTAFAFGAAPATGTFTFGKPNTDSAQQK